MNEYMTLLNRYKDSFGNVIVFLSYVTGIHSAVVLQNYALFECQAGCVQDSCQKSTSWDTKQMKT